jgi:hypothetical protein
VEVLGPPTSAQIAILKRTRRLRDADTLERIGAKLVRWNGAEWLGFPTLEGGWKLWALNHNGIPRLDGKKKLIRRNIGAASFVVSPALLKSNRGGALRLWDVEGESDLLAALDAGIPHAIASTGGASSLAAHKRHQDSLLALKVEEVVVVRDLDRAGRTGAQKAAQWWLEQGVAVRVPELPEELGDSGDLRDYLNGRPAKDGKAPVEPMGAARELEALADAAGQQQPPEQSEDSEVSTGAFTPSTPLASLRTHTPPWPEPLGEAAFFGLAGQFVRLIGPHTEADPAALLLQCLTQFGGVIGRSAYFVAEADRHYMNLFITLVGETAKGRKGSSYGQVESRFKAVDETWARERTMSGLSSGEGLIWQVRDPIYRHEPIKEKGRVIGYQDVEVDQGVTDKRLLVVEQELASTLRVLNREGNKLSAVIRQAWDTGNLRTLTKHSPAHATDAHIGIIGHITRDELRRYLDRTEAGNGFGNRFLWVCVRRSKALPEGGCLKERDLDPFITRLKAAVDTAKTRGEMRRNKEARALWFDVYGPLSEGRPGLIGAITSRAEAQVMRLACIYALLDCDSEIQSPHLQAALEVWRYAYDSACHIFGDALGDPKVDEAVALLRATPGGLTRSQLGRQLFGKHSRAESFDRVLGLLHRSGLAEPRVKPTPGRSAERWLATHRGAEAVYGGKGSSPPASGDAFTPSTPFTPSTDGSETPAVDEAGAYEEGEV